MVDAWSNPVVRWMIVVVLSYAFLYIKTLSNPPEKWPDKKLHIQIFLIVSLLSFLAVLWQEVKKRHIGP